MDRITRIPPKVAILMASALYAAVGFTVFSFFQRDLNAVEIAMNLAIAYPAFLFVATWKGIEIYWGRRIIERLIPDNELRTKAQTRAEKQAAIMSVLIAIFLSGAPLLGSYLSNAKLELHSFAPAFVWLWLLHIYGLNRIRLAFILLFSAGHKTFGGAKEVEGFAAGFIISCADDPNGSWHVHYDKITVQGVPRITLEARKKEINGEVIALDDPGRLALLGLITGNGNPYRLFYGPDYSHEADLEGLTAHEQMEAAACYSTALTQAKDLRDTASTH